MKIVVSEEALKWFEEEMELDTGDQIRFYARYGGSSPLHEGFSLGMNREQSMNPAVTLEKNNSLFYIEEDDMWFFDNHDLHVLVNETLDEIKYEYKKEA
ncbi:HesB/YadR/YfhF family protein [Viridibacillus sp. YIM B01967]|uniref:HesB/YadR/YfhF family protein n=1 Tax=Viridibacillus soli TaxID=2798301 RepID=A0ABS1H806_9BACL|nr:HesB/YadR/YfhF family protein [Viridibacillus soli]MBK3495252.1 HesB/YadR/YfhF family protein [Viridibacillus soli]